MSTPNGTNETVVGRPLRGQPELEVAGLALAVGEDCRTAGERTGVETPHAPRAKPGEPLGETDGRVHQGLSQPAEASGQDQRDPDRVHGGEDDVGAVRSFERPEHGREVAPVASGPAEPALDCGSREPRPARRLHSLEIVLDPIAARAQLVEAEEHVPLRRARLGDERAPALRRVAEGVEDPRHVQVR